MKMYRITYNWNIETRTEEVPSDSAKNAINLFIDTMHKKYGEEVLNKAMFRVLSAEQV